MTDQAQLDRFVSYMKLKIPGFEMRCRDVTYNDDPWIRRFIEWLGLFFVSDFKDGFAMTVYPYVYVPSTWPKDPKYIHSILRHEYIHLRDEQRFGWLYRLSYLFLAPTGLTMRALWERRAYAQSLIIEKELTGSIHNDSIEFYAKTFEGTSYLFMDPLSGRKKIKKLVARVESGELCGLWPYNDGDYLTLV